MTPRERCLVETLPAPDQMFNQHRETSPFIRSGSSAAVDTCEKGESKVIMQCLRRALRPGRILFAAPQVFATAGRRGVPRRVRV